MLLGQPFSQDGKLVLWVMPSGRFYSLLATFNFVPLLHIGQEIKPCYNIVYLVPSIFFMSWYIGLMVSRQGIDAWNTNLKKLQQLNNNYHHNNLMITIRGN